MRRGRECRSGSAPYRPIVPSLADKTIVLTGRDLTIEQVVQVARYGAKVALSPEARQRSADAHALLLEAAAEGVSVYWFNRGSGSGRERFIFTGDPLSPQNKKFLEERQLAIFRRGALAGMGPEISEEEVVRAMLVVRANTMSFEAASPQLTQRLLDLLNQRITPVVQSRGTVGEGDLGPFTNVGAVMVGAGNAYYRGVRMSAAEALKQAGLAPLAPFGADDSELESTNAYATGRVALLLYDAREALSWADLVYAIDLNGMNSSISPLSQPVQANRPFKWLNWDAARVLAMLKGSYLFELDDKRIIQDPGEPARLVDPAGLRVACLGATARCRADSNELLGSQPGGTRRRLAVGFMGTRHPAAGAILRQGQRAQSRAARLHILERQLGSVPDGQRMEAFTIALANMDTAVAQRMLRFTSAFFTVITPSDESPGEPGRFHLTRAAKSTPSR